MEAPRQILKRYLPIIAPGLGSLFLGTVAEMIPLWGWIVIAVALAVGAWFAYSDKLTERRFRTSTLIGAVTFAAVAGFVGGGYVATGGWIVGSAEPNRLTREQTEAPYLRGVTFYLADLARLSPDLTIANKTFEDCTVLGPGFAWVAPGSTITAPHFDASPEHFMLETPDGTPLHGVIKLLNVTMRNCRFQRIKLLVGPGAIEAAKKGATAAP